jgi:hypothetical protein
MTISTTASRISYNGNGATTAFSFPYRFLTNADLVVIKVAADGTETTLTLNTNYTVTGADDDAGGTVTLSVAPLSGQRVVIYRAVTLTQEVDYITGDPFPAETHERALDRLTMIVQQQQDAIDRSAKLSETSTADADTLIANINSLAAIEADVSAVAAIDTDVSDVAAIDSNVTTVAGIAANVTTVAGISSAVSTVAANIADIQNAEENADAAAASALAAQTAETNAETAEAAAEAAQAAAEAAQAAAEAVFDNFDDRYLGAKSSAPTVDNDGNTLQDGALYFDTTSNVLRVYDLGTTTWITLPVTALASLTDVTLTSIASGELLVWNGTKWINQTLTELAIAKTDAAQSFTAAQRGAISALTDGSSITPDFALANNFSLTIGGNRTLANPSNLTAGQSGVIVITQDGTGSRTLAYGSYWKFANGTAPSLTTTASAVDVLCYYVESSTRITARLIGDVK